MTKKQFKKQITYNEDRKAIEKLLHLSQVFYIRKATIKRVGKADNYKWRLIVEWE